MTKTIIAFYDFEALVGIADLQANLMNFCKEKEILGTILIADEGLNGTISCNNATIAAEFKAAIKKICPKIEENTGFKISHYKDHPFQKLKIKIKKEIVAIGMQELKINDNTKGEYLEPKEWDQFIGGEDVILIDCRNNYESDIGLFKNSIRPDTISFREFPEWVQENEEIFKDKKIAMYCTGGIRCEKTTAFMKQVGYQKIYHLKGGILQYFEDTANENGMFEGSCFVFDDRTSLDENLNPVIVYCQKCNKELTTDEVKYDLGHKGFEFCSACTKKDSFI